MAAKHLVNGDTIRQVTGGRVQYIHLLFDAHQIFFAQSVPSESYFPGHALTASDEGTRSEVQMLFPQLINDKAEVWQAVRPALKGFEAVLMAA